jgi:hypothetical protein
MSDVTERLQASRQESVANARAAGAEAGKRWASEDATWDELCAVVALDEENRNFEYLCGMLDENFGHDANEVFGFFRDSNAACPLPISDSEIDGFIGAAALVKLEAAFY